MTDIYEPTVAAVDAWRENLEILIQHLTKAEGGASREAMFVLLVQGLGLFGDSMLMQECSPVLKVLKSRIDRADFDGALAQALSFRKQLEEIRALVQARSESAGQDFQINPAQSPRIPQ